MSTTTRPKTADSGGKQNFVQVFNDAIDQLEIDAKAAGLNFTSLCRATKISRATPDRWRRNPPTTVILLSNMQEIVAEALAAKNKAN